MNILLVTPNYPPEIGACARRVHRLAQSLQEQGHRVEVLTVLPNYPSGKFRPEDRNRWARHGIEGGIKVHRVRFWASRSGRIFLRLFSALTMSLALLYFLPRVVRFRPDWIWVQTPPWPLPFVGIFFKKLTNSRLLLNLSDLHPQALLDLGKLHPNRLYRLLTRIERWAYRRADLLVGQSEEITSYLEVNVPEKKRVLYRNGLHDSQFFSARRAPNSVRFRWVYAGLLGAAQGLPELIESLDFQALGQELHIYGDGADRARIAAWIARYPHCGVWLHDPVPAEAVGRTLHQYDGALIAQKTAIRGTVPSKLYEAMAAGLPVVLLGSGESARLLRESGAGVSVPPGNWSKLEKALRDAGEPYALRSRRGREFAWQHFRHEIQLQRLMAEWEKLRQGSE